MRMRMTPSLSSEWRELEEGGIPLEPDEFRVGANPNGGLTIRKAFEMYENGIQELRNWRVKFVLPVFIRRNAPGKSIIREVSIHVPWWDDSIELLGEGTGRDSGFYTFSQRCDPPSLQYPSYAVINHKIGCTLTRGDIREGLLLAVGHVRPPDTYRNGELIPITVRIRDQWDFTHSGVINSELQRCRALDQERPKSTRAPLFSRRDKIVVPRSLKAPVLKERGRQETKKLQRALEGLLERSCRAKVQAQTGAGEEILEGQRNR